MKIDRPLDGTTAVTETVANHEPTMPVVLSLFLADHALQPKMMIQLEQIGKSERARVGR